MPKGIGYGKGLMEKPTEKKGFKMPEKKKKKKGLVERG